MKRWISLGVISVCLIYSIDWLDLIDFMINQFYIEADANYIFLLSTYLVSEVYFISVWRKIDTNDSFSNKKLAMEDAKLIVSSAVLLISCTLLALFFLPEDWEDTQKANCLVAFFCLSTAPLKKW